MASNNERMQNIVNTATITPQSLVTVGIWTWT